MGVFRGLGIKLPDPKALPEVKDEWVVILGGAGSVGQYAVQVRDMPNNCSSLYCMFNIEAVQLAKLSGYKVVATCSQKNASVWRFV